MKTVFNNEMVCHVWAQQNQDCGRNQNGSLYFTGSTIYSYGSHFPIANFVKSDTVLFTCESYGNTTAKHKNYTRQAIPSWANVFTVPCVDITLGTKHDCTKKQNKSFHAENIEYYKTSINDYVLKANRARTNKDFYNSLAVDLVDECNSYIDTFKLRNKHVVLPDADKILADAEKAKKARIRKEKAVKVKALKDAKEKINNWLRGDVVRIPYTVDVTFLRVNKGLETIETSKGATFPIKHAKLALKVIEKCKRDKAEFVPNGKKIHLGHFTIDKIHKNGDVKAGCHFVKYAQIEAIADQVKNFATVGAV